MSADLNTAAGRYAARVDAVIEQRTRLRGLPPTGDVFAGIPAGHNLLQADPDRKLEANLAIVAGYLEAGDVIIDVGGGAGRNSLPFANRCREIVNVDPSAVMGRAFAANAAKSGITNVRFIEGDWLDVTPVPQGTVCLVNHVAYLTRDIVRFIEKLESACTRRVLLTVNTPPPPTRNRALYALAHGEPEALVPDLPELANVLWELGIQPDIVMLPNPSGGGAPVAPTREAAIKGAIGRFGSDQWTFWDLGPALEKKLREVLETNFDRLFDRTEAGYRPNWINSGREVLVTWEPRRRG